MLNDGREASPCDSDFARALKLEQAGSWSEAIAIYEALANRLAVEQNAVYAINCAARLRERQVLAASSDRCEALQTELSKAHEETAKLGESLGRTEKLLNQTAGWWPFNVIVLAVLIVALWLSNPSEQSFKTDYAARLTKQQAKQKADAWERILGVVTTEFVMDFKSVDNYWLFSVGTVRIKIPGGGSIDYQVPGACGKWWWEWGDSPWAYGIGFGIVAGCIGHLLASCFHDLTRIVWKARYILRPSPPNSSAPNQALQQTAGA